MLIVAGEIRMKSGTRDPFFAAVGPWQTTSAALPIPSAELFTYTVTDAVPLG